MPPELLKKPPKIPLGPKRAPSVLEPSWIRDLFEGIVDTGMGAIGVGPDTKANRIGALAGMALPFGKLRGKPSISQIHPSKPVTQMGPSSSEVDRLIKQMNGRMTNIPQKGLYVDDPKFITGSPKGRYDTKLKAEDFPAQNSVAMGMTPGKDATYDSAGRYLGPAGKKDPMFEAHVESSVGKIDKTKFAPSANQVEELMKRYRK